MTEHNLILEYLLKGFYIHKDVAAEDFGVLHLHSVISGIEKIIPVERMRISRPHPVKGYLREINMYFIYPDNIERWKDHYQREKMRKEQVSLTIAKIRSRHNKTLYEMCRYQKEETLMRKISVIYGAIKLDESKPENAV